MTVTGTPTAAGFDVFLSYSRADQQAPIRNQKSLMYFCT